MADTTIVTPPGAVNSFGDLLRLLDNGALDTRLMAEVENIIEGVEAIGGDGKASLTLRIDFAFKGGVVNAVPSIKSGLPPPRALGTTALWTTDDGRFTRANPNQMSMELRDVNAPRGEKSV